MADRIFWDCLEELPKQEAAFYEWNRLLSGWHCFNTFYTHYLRAVSEHAKFLECTTPCEHGCPRQVVENPPSDITAVCPQEKTYPIQLKFRNILIYSLHRDALHQALCVSLKITYYGDRQLECRNPWHLGDYFGMAVYLTYRTTELTKTIEALCQLLCQAPFILLASTGSDLSLESEQLLMTNNSTLFVLADNLSLQLNGLFKVKQSLTEYQASAIHKFTSLIETVRNSSED